MRDTSSRSSISRDQVLDLALDHVAGPRALRLGQLLQPQQLHGGADRRQRVAQLVGQHRQELVLAPVRLLQRRGRRLERRGALGDALLELGFSRSSARVLRYSSAKTLTLARRISGTTGTGT